MQEDHFAAVFDLNGTKLRISEVADHAPQSHTVLGREVADISETVKQDWASFEALVAAARKPSPDEKKK